MIITPRDWQQIAQGEALTLSGMPEAHTKLVEAKRYGALANEIERLRAAIVGLLRFHQEGDDGAELPREYWSPGYREAVETAEALVGSNLEVTGTAAALSPQGYACDDKGEGK